VRGGEVDPEAELLQVPNGVVPPIVVPTWFFGLFTEDPGVMVIGTVAQAGVAIPVAYLAVSVFDLGLAGVLLGFAGSWVRRTVLTPLRYPGGAWQRTFD
jgi:hypothetical protein